MVKTCEFCMQSRPLIYCKSDAAFLCLSCDARVHSANALSNRHFRVILCEGCGDFPSYVRCLDHQMFMCRGCDRNLHNASAQHQKRVSTRYMGCPSAKDFAVLWGYDLNELGAGARQEKVVSTSFGSAVHGGGQLENPTEFHPQIECSSLTEVNSMVSIFGANSEVGSSNPERQIFRSNRQNKEPHLILQQIVDLKRLLTEGSNNSSLLTEGSNNSSFICGQMKMDMHFYNDDTSRELDADPDYHPQHPIGPDIDFQQINNRHHELQVQTFPSPFSQLDNLTSSLSVGIPLHGDPFWQCKSPARSSQLWSQNMQDLGTCDEIDCCDGLNIPDVDLTFRNYEELFGGDQDQIRALFDVKDLGCSSIKKDMSVDGSAYVCSRENEDTSVASSFHITWPSHGNRDNGPSEQAHPFSGSVDSLHPIRPSYSTLSFSLSRFGVENSASDYIDTGISPNIIKGEPSYDSPDQIAYSEARESVLMRYKDKKRMRMYEKRFRDVLLKARADVRKHVKGRFVKAEGYESDTGNVTRSF